MNNIFAYTLCSVSKLDDFDIWVKEKGLQAYCQNVIKKNKNLREIRTENDKSETTGTIALA